MSAEEFLHKWSVEEIHEMVYEHSATDMLVAMPLPLTDLYHDGLSPWTECAKLAQLDPDRTVMWGTVNPLEGKKALDDVTRQVEEYGAKAFKFYNVRYEDGGQVPWRMDDPKVAFPVFERIQELGVHLIGVHKGVPLGPQMIEHTQTWDMDGAAGAFPDINFVIYHVGLPFIDETCWRSATRTSTRRLLQPSTSWCARPGCSQSCSASCCSGAARTRSSMGVRHPSGNRSGRWRRSGNFELPQDLVDGYGYPQLTEQANKILGENLLRLHGMDVEATRARLAG